MLIYGIALFIAGWLLTALGRSRKRNADIIEAYEAEIDQAYSDGFVQGWWVANWMTTSRKD